MLWLKVSHKPSNWLARFLHHQQEQYHAWTCLSLTNQLAGKRTQTGTISDLWELCPKTPALDPWNFHRSHQLLPTPFPEKLLSLSPGCFFSSALKFPRYIGQVRIGSKLLTPIFLHLKGKNVVKRTRHLNVPRKIHCNRGGGSWFKTNPKNVRCFCFFGQGQHPK